MHVPPSFWHPVPLHKSPLGSSYNEFGPRLPEELEEELLEDELEELDEDELEDEPSPPPPPSGIILPCKLERKTLPVFDEKKIFVKYAKTKAADKIRTTAGMFPNFIKYILFLAFKLRFPSDLAYQELIFQRSGECNRSFQ